MYVPIFLKPLRGSCSCWSLLWISFWLRMALSFWQIVIFGWKLVQWRINPIILSSRKVWRLQNHHSWQSQRWQDFSYFEMGGMCFYLSPSFLACWYISGSHWHHMLILFWQDGKFDEEGPENVDSVWSPSPHVKKFHHKSSLLICFPFSTENKECYHWQ